LTETKKSKAYRENENDIRKEINEGLEEYYNED
jgi:hypothetical protein